MSGSIEPGREREVLALFAPYELGREVKDGWKLWNVGIARQSIQVELRGPNELKAFLTLTERVDASEASASFGITRDAGCVSGPARPAADSLVAALGKNDAGGFWRARTVSTEQSREASPSSPVAVAWPLGVALVSVALMLWVARRS